QSFNKVNKSWHDGYLGTKYAQPLCVVCLDDCDRRWLVVARYTGYVYLEFDGSKEYTATGDSNRLSEHGRSFNDG
ncbi:hypothetical protein KEM55_008260, partial [Ascosphaera atra]